MNKKRFVVASSILLWGISFFPVWFEVKFTVAVLSCFMFTLFVAYAVRKKLSFTAYAAILSFYFCTWGRVLDVLESDFCFLFYGAMMLSLMFLSIRFIWYLTKDCTPSAENNLK